MFLYNFVRMSFANERAYKCIRIVEGLNDQSTNNHDTDKSKKEKEEMSREEKNRQSC